MANKLLILARVVGKKRYRGVSPGPCVEHWLHVQAACVCVCVCVNVWTGK